MLRFISGRWRGSPVFGGSSAKGMQAKSSIALFGQAILQLAHPVQALIFTTGRVFM